MESDKYPEDFWRGLSSKDFISAYGDILAAAFQFDKEVRDDGYRELSINWNDNDEALGLVLNQKKVNGDKQFPFGAAKLNLDKVKMFLSNFIQDKRLTYERNALENNPYHGNLLVKADLDKQSRTLISNGLALIAGRNIHN